MKHISKGSLHLHTNYSDGTGTIDEIARDAVKAGLDWIIITDHNTLAGLHNSEEGWYDGLAVIVGDEISPDTCNHYLALGINEEISPELPPEKVIEKVKAQEGFGFVAHPDESLTRKNHHRPLRWMDWGIRGFDGIEIWNYLSDWTDNYNEKNAIYSALARNYIIKGPTPKTLNWWDEVNNETDEIIPGIGGADSHAFKVKCFKIFPYIDTFKTITNYLYLEKELSKDFNQAKKQILNSLKAGDNIIVNRHWTKKPDNNLLFTVQDKKLLIKIPQKAHIKVFRSGELIIEKKTEELSIEDLTPGKYRFEAYYKGKPWIFSNPIKV